MNDAHERFQSDRQRTGAIPTPRTWGENVGDRRRRRSMEIVRSRVEEIRTLVESAVPGAGLVTGAATCAEVRIDERETTHRFIRVGLSVAADRLDLVTGAPMATVVVRNLTGAEVQRIQANGALRIRLDLAVLPTGAYLVEARMENGGVVRHQAVKH